MGETAYALERNLAIELVGDLVHTYPGYHWGVTVEDGLITIHNHELSGQHGYRIKAMHGHAWHTLVRTTRRGAGELLERYGVSRTRRDADEVAALARDARGNALGETDS